MAKDKKGNGEGSIFKLKDGTWRGFITIGFDSKGKQVKKWRRGTTRREVADKLNEIAAQTGSRLVTRPERATIEEWLRHFADLRGHEVRHRTRANYKHYLSKILPELGHIELQNLKPLQVRSFYKKLTEQGLSPSVKKHIHFFLKAAFKDAFRMEMIDKNPMSIVDAPKGGNVIEAKVWQPREVRAFLEAAQSERLFALFSILLTTGMRIGEALGLKWSDLTNETLKIERSLGLKEGKPAFGPPKTDRGYRTIYLSDDELTVLAMHKENQILEQELATNWQEHDLIFCSEIGTPINRNNISKRPFKRILERSGVPRIRLHDLRHTYITLARDAGLDAEIIANRVGQDVRVTLKIYSQVTEARKKKAAISLEDLLDENED